MASNPFEIKVTIDLDATPFKRAVETVDEQMARLRRVTDRTSQHLDKVGTSLKNLGGRMTKVSAGIGLATAAAFRMTQVSAQSANAIDKQSKSIGLSAAAYQELGFAIGQVSDLSSEQFSNAIRQMNTRLGQAAEGNKGLIEKFSALGFSQEELASGAITAEEAFNALNASAQKLESPAAAAALAASVMGEEAAKLGPIMMESGAEIDGLRDKAQDLGLVLDDEMVAAGAKFEDQMDELGRQMRALRDTVSAELLPVFTNTLIPAIQDKVVPALASLAAGVADIIQWFGNLPGPVQEALGVITTALAVGGPVLLAIGAFSSALSVLVAASGPVGLFIAAAALLTTAWLKWGDDIKALLSGVKQWFVDGFNGAIEWVKSLPDQFIQFGADIIEGFRQGIVNKFDEVKEGLMQPFRDFKGGIAEFFGIKSPSRVFHEFGAWISEGFANGISDSAYMVSEAVRVLGDSATSVMGDAASDIVGSMAQVFKGSKPLAIAQALINTWQGATEALKLPWPQNLAAFATTLATGMNAVNNIKSTTPGGGGGGGGGSAGTAATSGAPPQPLEARISGVSPDTLFSGASITGLFDALQDEAGDRGLSVSFAP